MATFIEPTDDLSGDSELDVVETILTPEPKVEDKAVDVPEKYRCQLAYFKILNIKD